MRHTDDLFLSDVTCQFLDVSALAIAAQLASYLTLSTPLPILWPLSLLLPCIGSILLLAKFGGTQTRPRFPARSQLQTVTTMTVIVTTVVFGMFSVGELVSEIGHLSRLWLVYWLASSALFMGGIRVVMRFAFHDLPSITSDRMKRVLMIGYGATGKDIHQGSLHRRYLGYDVRAVYVEQGQDIEASQHVDRITSLDKLANYIRTNEIDEVWITLPVDHPEKIQQIGQLVCSTTAYIRFFPDAYSSAVFAGRISEFLGMQVITLRPPDCRSFQFLAKSILDRILAAVALILLLPLLLVIALVIKCTSHGPVFYKQARHGLHGRPFAIYKFRSMKTAQNKEHGSFKQAQKNDCRVTPFGAFIRRTSIDELPQFLNVLKGEMSIVGPRPHAIEHNDLFSNCIPDYTQRHRVKPGITGWAQINGFRGETDTIEKMLKRVRFDIQYIEEWCLWLDIKIIIWTAIKGWTGNNAY